MNTALALVCAGTGVLLAAVAGIATARGRRLGLVELIAAGVCEAAALVQAITGTVLLVRADTGASGHHHVSPVVFGGYLLAALLVPPVGVFWAIGERSRWGTGVLAIAGLVAAVLVARLEQIWRTGA